MWMYVFEAVCILCSVEGCIFVFHFAIVDDWRAKIKRKQLFSEGINERFYIVRTV